MPKIRHKTYHFSNNSLSESKNQSKPPIHFKHKSGMLNNIIKKLKSKKILISSKVHNSNLRLKKKQKKSEKKVHYLTDNQNSKNKNENEINNNNEKYKNSKALSSKKIELKINKQFNRQISNQLSQLSKISENNSFNNINGTNLDNSICKSTVDRKEMISKFFFKDTYNNLNDSLNGTDYEKSSSDIISFHSMQYKDKKMKSFFLQKKNKKNKGQIITKRENFDFENDIYDKINYINNKRNSIKNTYFSKIKQIIDYYKINKENTIQNIFEKQIFQNNKNFKPSDFKTNENICKNANKFKKLYHNLNILNSHFKTLNKYYIDNCIVEKYFNVQISKIIYIFNFIGTNDLVHHNLFENFSLKKPHLKPSHHGKMNNVLGMNITLKIFPGFDLIFLSNFHRRDFEYDIDMTLKFKNEERLSLSKRRASVIFSCLKSSKSEIKFSNRTTWKYLIKKTNRLKKEERDEKSGLLKKSLKRNQFYSRNKKTNLRSER